MKLLIMVGLLALARMGAVDLVRAPFLAEAKAVAFEKAVAEARAEELQAAANEAKAKAAAAKAAADKGSAVAADLQPGVALKADGKFIDVEIGHAAPLVADLGDGKQSLLVGQFGGGKLRIYALEKQNGQGFQAGKFEFLKAGTVDCSVPSG